MESMLITALLTMLLSILSWIKVFYLEMLFIEAKYIIDLNKKPSPVHQEKPLRSKSHLHHERRRFEDTLCKHPIISNKDLQTEWTCNDEMVNELGYPRGTRCDSKCLEGSNPLRGTSMTVECVNEHPHLGQLSGGWNPKPLFCKPDTCVTSRIKVRLPARKGRWEPEKCLLQQSVIAGTECRFECIGNDYIKSEVTPTATCSSAGRWIYNNKHCSRSAPQQQLLHYSKPRQEATVMHDKNWRVTDLDVPFNIETTDEYNMIDPVKRINHITTETYQMKGSIDETPVDHIVTDDKDVKRGMNEIFLGIKDMFHRLPPAVNILIITSISIILISLLTICAYYCCANKSKRKYAVIDNNGQQLLPLAGHNINNNSFSSQASVGGGTTRKWSNKNQNHRHHRSNNCHPGNNSKHFYKRCRTNEFSSCDSPTSSETSASEMPQYKRHRKKVVGLELILK